MSGNGDVVNVNFAALDTGVSDMGAAEAAIDTKLGEILTIVAPLLSTWDGTAREAFQSRQNAWNSAATTLHGLLRDSKVKLGDSAVDYRAVNKGVADSFPC